jgi:hypothetical protein
MLMNSKLFTYKDKLMIYCEYGGFGNDLEGLAAEVNAVDEWICSQPLNSVLSVANVAGSYPTPAALVMMEKSTTRTRPYIRKQAILGLTGERSVLARIVTYISGLDMDLFDDLERAKDWLAED